MGTVDTPLRIQSEDVGGATVVRLVGSATMDQCDTLSHSLHETLARHPKLLVVDLADLQFICSLGLGGLVDAHRQAQRHGGTLRLAAPRPEIAKLLAITKLDQILNVFDSPTAAVQG